jgi:hypothetical protein
MFVTTILLFPDRAAVIFVVAFYIFIPYPKPNRTLFMTRGVLFVAFSLITITTCFSQDNGFPFGKATYRELEKKIYEKDSTAEAVVLNEFGETYIDNHNDNNLIFEYHVKIKILKQNASSLANVEIPIRKSDKSTEKLISIKASAFNLENGILKEFPFDPKQVFTENLNKYRDAKKFAIPNVKEGSIIEYQYKLESPFIFNWRSWEFQSELPKAYSEYWTAIPGNYIYNISLRGFLKLSKDESKIVDDCFSPGGGNVAQCALSKYAMKDVPAFKAERYMTAQSNFLSSMNFELSELRHFDGRIEKFTKTWKDAEVELATDPKFGIQIKRGKEILDGHIDDVIGSETDPLVKAKKIYNFIRDWYRWNNVYGIFSDLGIKKAFDQKVGNVGDINLSLVAACLYADLDAEPVLISTRENGVPVELYPVITDFNYVIARVNIGDKVFYLDATDDFHPFGLLPDRCLNGRARVMRKTGSLWIDVKPTDRRKETVQLSLKLEKDGIIRGTISIASAGYEGVSLRKKIYGYTNQQDYVNELDTELAAIDIKKFELKNFDELEKPLVRQMEIEMDAFSGTEQNLLFNPFLFKQWTENPFKANERLFPVDFATPHQYVMIVNMEYDPAFEIVNAIEKVGLALPNGGGNYLFEMQNANNKLTISTSLLIAKSIFPSTEYFHLKELFSRMIQIQNNELIIKRVTKN